MKHIVLPNGLTSIGGCAFENCSSLVEVNLPPKVQKIGYCAFHNCTSLKCIVIPPKVSYVYLETGIFSDCKNLESVSILMEDLVVVPRNIFDGCTSLKEVSFAKKPCRIESFAFRNCKSLTSIEYQMDAEVDIDAFVGCDNLAMINGQPVKQPDVFCIKDGKLLRVQVLDKTEYVIPDNVTTIAARFNDCKNLKSVVIVKNVQTIEDFAFDGCQNLENVIFGESLQEIGNYAFRKTRLSNITIPEGIRIIGTSAFSDCTNLVSVTFPSSLEGIGCDVCYECDFMSCDILMRGWGIGENAFCGCHNLEQFYGDNVSEDGRCLILNGCIQAFASANLTEYTIPDGARRVMNVFDNCKNIKKLTFPSTIQNFPTIVDCNNLQTVNIPEDVSELSSTPFYRCENLKEFRGNFSSEDNRCLINEW